MRRVKQDMEREKRTANPRADDLHSFHERAVGKGVSRWVYVPVRMVFLPFFLVYFRLKRIGIHNVPDSGPLLIAANHRSFLDPFVIGSMTTRPVYYMAKRELFANRLQAWFLNSLGAFPVDRGTSDGDAMASAKAIIERGDCVVLFPEGTRIRKGPLAAPRRGIGRLALETGAPIVPVALTGTENVRRGWRIRPRKVRIRAGQPLRFPRTPNCSPELAGEVTERVWDCIALQWESLGGERPPLASRSVAKAANEPERTQRAA
jgi:1-acyl-sn-glycerol-3-phosphate acyltransferase